MHLYCLPLSNTEVLYSHHIFMFPFKWKHVKYAVDDTDLEKQTNIKDISDYYETQNKEWKHSKFKIDSLIRYNEFNYYHDFVREILYDLDEELQDKISQKHTLSLRHYEYSPARGKQYLITLPEKKYKLEIDSILLHIYDTGTGIVSFHLCNREISQSSPSDILNINQYGRRLYPPFFDVDRNLIGSQQAFQDNDFKEGLTGAHDIAGKRGTFKKELPLSIEISDLGIKEDFTSYFNYQGFKNGSFLIPAHLKIAFPDNKFISFITDMEKEKEKIRIEPVLDDRMFVVCWYGNDHLANYLKQKNRKSEHWESDDWWYRYIFVDSGIATCQNKQMKVQLIKENTNCRWSGYGTLYGISRYSFVTLTSQLSTLSRPEINAAFLVNHVQSIYYKMSELALLQRATLLRFSDEVARISSRKDNNMFSSVRSLYNMYIQFVNRIFFREATAQEQGIELYSLLQEKMNLKKDVEDLEREIEEIHQFANLMEQYKQTKEAHKLTFVATVLLPFTVITGFFGMNFFPDPLANKLFNGEFYPAFWLGLLITLILSFSIIFYFNNALQLKLRESLKNFKKKKQ